VSCRLTDPLKKGTHTCCQRAFCWLTVSLISIFHGKLTHWSGWTTIAQTTIARKRYTSGELAASRVTTSSSRDWQNCSWSTQVNPALPKAGVYCSAIATTHRRVHVGRRPGRSSLSLSGRSGRLYIPRTLLYIDAKKLVVRTMLNCCSLLLSEVRPPSGKDSFTAETAPLPAATARHHPCSGTTFHPSQAPLFHLHHQMKSLASPLQLRQQRWPRSCCLAILKVQILCQLSSSFIVRHT
jgi:hypothetical protein